jgi:DNA-binding Lrp family transcriptional regulator
MAIIKEMGIDGRQSVSNLAKKLGTSRATVGKKLQRLLDESILRVAGIVLPGTLGYQTNAIIGLNVIPSEIDNVADKLVSNENVHMMFISAGRHDIIIWALFQKSEDLSNFLRQELGQISGITNTETMINLGIKKLSMSYLTPNR